MLLCQFGLMFGLCLLHFFRHIFEFGRVLGVFLDDFFGTAHPRSLTKNGFYVLGIDNLTAQKQFSQSVVTFLVLFQ